MVLPAGVQHGGSGRWGGRSLKGEELRENDGRLRKTCFEASDDPPSFILLEGKRPCRAHLLPLVATAEALLASKWLPLLPLLVEAAGGGACPGREGSCCHCLWFVSDISISEG